MWLSFLTFGTVIFLKMLRLHVGNYAIFHGYKYTMNWGLDEISHTCRFLTMPWNPPPPNRIRHLLVPAIVLCIQVSHIGWVVTGHYALKGKRCQDNYNNCQIMV